MCSSGRPVTKAELIAGLSGTRAHRESQSTAYIPTVRKLTSGLRVRVALRFSRSKSPSHPAAQDYERGRPPCTSATICCVASSACRHE